MVKFWKRWKKYLKISKATPIMRRYFVMNGFDGCLTSLGIIIGTWIINGGIFDLNSSVILPNYLVRYVILTGMVTAISLGVSGLWSAFLTEEAERIKKIRHIEFIMRKEEESLEGTLYSKAQSFASILIGIVNGIAPTLTSIICLIPFIIDIINPNPNYFAFLGSLFLIFLMLFVFGMFLGKISRENILISGLKMLLAGLVLMAISMLFPVQKPILKILT